MNGTNEERNKSHYESLYSRYNVNNILYWLNNLEAFLERSISTETSWNAIYKFDFIDNIKGRKILEVGCGDCLNAAVMAALGAEVYANDIAMASGNIIEKLNKEFAFPIPIKFIEGDFLDNKLPEKSFDYVIGKAFLHHLTLPVEEKFIIETVRLLKDNGEARYFEPAVNSRLLDEIRWYVPVGSRPSKFNKRHFKIWKSEDPHPDRTLSSRHFEKIGKKYFREVKILPIGSIERFGRFLKWGESRNSFRRWALRMETYLPEFINRTFTRSQLIIYRKPVSERNSQCI